MDEPTCSEHFSELNMLERDLELNDIFRDLNPTRFNEFGLRREMRFISERIIAEYDPDDTLSVREIIHPMDPFRTDEPFFCHKLTDKSKKEFVTSIDFHEHITYFPYAKNTGDICLARYISNFNDINFTKISGQQLCSLPGETIYGLRVGRLDKAMIAVNHRNQNSVNTKVTVLDIVKPARNIAYFESARPINTLDWIWHGPFHLAMGDDVSLRIADVRCPKRFNSVFFDRGVKRTALTPTRPLEIAVWDGRNVLLYDIRRPEVPCAIHPVDLKPKEVLIDMKFNPYLTNELFIHTNNFRVAVLDVNPAHLVGGRAIANDMYEKWQIITFKHIDRGCTAARQAELRRKLMPFEEEKVPLLNYFDQYEAAKLDSELTIPFTWTMPTEVDDSIFSRLQDISEYEFESYLSKAVERVAAERDYRPIKPEVIYEVNAVDTFDFVFPGVNGIMCLDREKFTYRIETSPRHYEGCVNLNASTDTTFYYRGIQIQEMIPAQTLTMMCTRLKAGWNAYQTLELPLRDLAFKITQRNKNLWATWLRNTAIIQYGYREFVPTRKRGKRTWRQHVKLPKNGFPEVTLPIYEKPQPIIAAEEISRMVAPFFRLFLPDPIPDPYNYNPMRKTVDEPTALPPDTHPDYTLEYMGLPGEFSMDMRTLCKCHAKMRYYQSKQKQRRYMYQDTGKAFFVAASRRIREKFFRIGWKAASKSEIMDHRVKIDTKYRKYEVFDDLKKFSRFKPREFQKRVLPPKLITDSSNVLMKPEYIKEREEKEREMREKAAQPITAPIGLTLTKSKKEKPKPSSLLAVDGDDDPERARFLARAAMQLADNEEEAPSTKSSTPTSGPTRNTSAASTPVPSAHSTVSSRENDDFEYETAEDAFFGIKKKRMYVLYQSATKPLGLFRYKPDRLAEHTFVRQLEHLVYWGKRTFEKKILKGDFEEDYLMMSTVKERASLDLKLALNSYMKVGWQTFYEKNFFFSERCSYNQLLRTAFQVYNNFRLQVHKEPMKLYSNITKFCRIKPRSIFEKIGCREAKELRLDVLMTDPLFPHRNKFLNYLSEALPYQMYHLPLMTSLEYQTENKEFDGELSLMEEKPTAMYDRRIDYMFPIGRLRFCEFEIPPEMMALIRERRKIIPLVKPECYYLEDLMPTVKEHSEYELRRTRSCPILFLDLPSQEKEYDEVVYTEGVRRYMAREFVESRKNRIEEQFDSLIFDEDCLLSSSILESPVTIETVVQNIATLREMLPFNTEFIEWDSPMIADRDRKTGKPFARRVVPYPPPPHPRQNKLDDPKFEEIPMEVRMDASRNTAVTYLVNMPMITIWPGLQILDEGRDEKFTRSTILPRTPKKKYINRLPEPFFLYTDFENMHERLESQQANICDYEDFALSRYAVEKKYPMVRIPVFETRSLECIPLGLINEIKPEFFGMFLPRTKSRYKWRELAEQRGRRELQSEIIDNRSFRFRQIPSFPRYRLDAGEEVKLEEDDLRTSSSSEDDDYKPVKIISKIDPKKEVQPKSIMRRKMGVSESENMQKLGTFTGTEVRTIAGSVPNGSPNKDTQTPKEPKNVTWGVNTEHLIEKKPKERPVSIMDHQLLRHLIGFQFRTMGPIGDRKHWKPIRRRPPFRSDVIHRKLSMNSVPVRRFPLSCQDCLDEPWPSKEVCIKCYPRPAVHKCTVIINMRIPCYVCTAPIYKFLCSNYKRYERLAKEQRYERYGFKKQLSKKDWKKYAVKGAVEEELFEPLWDTHNYTAGNYTVGRLFDEMRETDFQHSQCRLLSEYFQREFFFVTWNMDDEKSESVYESEQFANAFDRDADVDMMRDTMNTISQDGDMDMMTTYDQRTGKRVRRWISYQALATRVRKQDEKVNRRRRLAEREARILAGEVTVNPSILAQVKKRKQAQLEAQRKVDEEDSMIAAEKKKIEDKLWKKKAVPNFIEDHKQTVTNVKPSKTEDWLESSGSEDELPPIRARILSPELKEFIATIRKHMEHKPENFNGLRVVYGKLFEKRPLLKNDIVLVTKKRRLRRKPPPFRIQRIPLDEKWVNDSLRVGFLPAPNVTFHSKDSNKWTIPFYSSRNLQLTPEEMRKRAFRPPTPPPTLKKEYNLMKYRERSHYYHKNRNQSNVTKKAKVARFMRYRRKLVGSRNIGSRRKIDQSLKKWQEKTKQWTSAYSRANGAIERRSRRYRRAEPVERQAVRRSRKSYVFALTSKKPGQDAVSSSYPEYCRVFVVPSKRSRRAPVVTDVTEDETKMAEIKRGRLRNSNESDGVLSSSTSTIVADVQQDAVKTMLHVNRPRGRSVPRHVGSGTRARVAATRSFSVDCDRRLKKVLKRLVHTVRKMRKIPYPKIPPFKLREMPVSVDVITVNEPANEPVSTSKPISVLSMQNKVTQWTRKMKALGDLAIVKPKGYRKRPLLPRWLPTSHETESSDASPSEFRHQHMRSKRYTKTRTPLPDKPTRSRVLNAARKIKAVRQLNLRMKYEPPIPVKIADVHLYPWEPKKKCLSRCADEELERSRHQTLSWKQMLKKLTNYRVKVNRVLLKDMSKIRRPRVAPDEDEEKTIEILITPTPNLKSCMRGETRRTLDFSSKKEEKKEEPLFGFGSTQRLIKSPTSLDAPEAPKTVKTVPSLLKYSLKDEMKAENLSSDLTTAVTESSTANDENSESVEPKRVESPLTVTTGDEEVAPVQTAPPPLRLLKPVDSPLASDDILPEPKKEDEDGEVKEIAPPRKLPADQQWRAAMMARRNMGSSRQLGRPAPPVAKNTASSLKSPRSSQSPTSPKPDAKPEDVSDAAGPPKSPENAPSKEPPPSNLTLSELMGIRRNPPEAAKSPSTSPQPAQGYPGELEPLENIVWPIPEDHVIDLVPDPSDTRSRVHPSLRTARKNSSKTAPPDSKKKEAEEKPKKKSFFQRLFSSSKKSALSNSAPSADTPSTSSATPETSVESPAEPTPAREEPLLPRVKRPESGQLTRRREKPAMFIPDSSSAGRLAKIVDGKPVYANASRPRPLARKKPDPPPPPPESSSSSSDEEEKLARARPQYMPTSSSPEEFNDADWPPPIVTSAKTAKAEQKAHYESCQVIIPDTNVPQKAVPGPDAEPPMELRSIMLGFDPTAPTSSSRPSSGKTVTFGPTSAFGASYKQAYALLNKPVPASVLAAMSPKKPVVKKEPVKEPVKPPVKPPVKESVKEPVKEPELVKNDQSPKTKDAEPAIATEVEKSKEVVEKATEKKEEATSEVKAEEPGKQAMKKRAKQVKKMEEQKKEPSEEVAAPSTVPAPVVSPDEQPKPAKKSFLASISPFGKINPKSKKKVETATTPEPPTLPPSSEATSSQPSTSAQNESTSSAEQPEPAPSTGRVKPARQRPTRKTSTRRQLKIGDPSPLALSGDASLPKPAEQSPERPPHLDPPKEVKNYKPPSQRKYYTRLGQEWKPPSAKKAEQEEETPVLSPLVEQEPEKTEEPEKKKRMKKRKPEPVEPTLVLDGMEYFSKLTAENLKLHDREHGVDLGPKTESMIGTLGDSQVSCPEIKRKTVLKFFKKLKNKTDPEDAEKIALTVDFKLCIDGDIPARSMEKLRRSKYETSAAKLRRMVKTRNRRIEAVRGNKRSKQVTALRAVRKARKVQFALTHGKKFVPVVSSNFKPKSILKAPKEPISWWYRVDSNGNKRFLRTFGPSERQLKLEKRAETESKTLEEEKPTSFLEYYVQFLTAVGARQLKEAGKPWNENKRPEDVLVDLPSEAEHLPSRSLSWTTASSTSSLKSLLDELDGQTAASDENKTSDQPDEKKSDEASSEAVQTLEEVPASQPSPQPFVFFGMTITRSPSTSTSEVPETVESTAADGSQIVEYVGQEETTTETVRRRFDPFVRPLNALFKAFTSTEVGTEAGSQSSTSRRSRLGAFFRRQSDTSDLRPASSSPTRRRSTRASGESVSQNSSAEDILALIEEEAKAKAIAEEKEKKERERIVFPPLRLPAVIPPGEPMYPKPKILAKSLYTQFVKAKRKSRKERKLRERPLPYDSRLNDTQKLISFYSDEYMRLKRYPRPLLNVGLLGKYPSSSVKILARSRGAQNRATMMILKKLDDFQTRLVRTKISMSQMEQYKMLPHSALTTAAVKTLKKVSNRKPKKIRVQYKFKKTCVKYRVDVTISEESRKLLRGEKAKNPDEIVPSLCAIPKIITTVLDSDEKPPSPVKFQQGDNEEESDKDTVDNYDGDEEDDGETRASKNDYILSKRVKIRQNQKQTLLKNYFQFAVKMARKVARRSLGPRKPLIFYAFISQIKSRMRQFMKTREEEKKKFREISKKKTVFARNEKKTMNEKKRKQRAKRLSKPFNVRHALKYGNTVQKEVIVEQSKFTLQKNNARVEAFFDCLDEYIDVGTIIKLVFRSKNTILPMTAFDPKTQMVDSDVHVSQSPCNTDSDFSSDTPENPKFVEKRMFFRRRHLESTYHVKGLPGLIYLAKLVEAKVSDDIERNVPFVGKSFATSGLLVYVSPVRRLMLNSLGLRMIDRLDGVKLNKDPNEKFQSWFARLFTLLCYGRGDGVEFIIDELSRGIGMNKRRYEKMDLSFQARVVYKLYKKMIFMEHGKEAKFGIKEFCTRAIDLDEENPFAKPVVMGPYDRYIEQMNDIWEREEWMGACDWFLENSEHDPDVLVTTRACVYGLRMVFLRGYSQDIVDDIVALKLPVREKLLFIINLSPSEYIVENIVKIMNCVRGLDRLTFSGLGYHADTFQILFDEARESGDPQLIAHLIRVGRCLDRRSGESSAIDYNHQDIKNRDFGEIMHEIFTNGNPTDPRGPPTMDEMFPYRYIRHDDGTHVKKSTEELAYVMECEVTRYMAILELTKGAAITKNDLDHNTRFNRRPKRFNFDMLCTGCKVNVAQARNLGALGRTLCVSTMPLIEQDKDKKRWPNAKILSPRLTFENYIETLDPVENKMLMAKDVEEEKTDITVQVLPSRWGCYQCHFSLPKCSICLCPYLNDHMDYELKVKNESFGQFSVCNICNHGGHVHHIAKWFATEKYCPVAGCDCRCQRSKQARNLKGRLRRHMMLSANMRAKSHLCNPECAHEVDIDEGYLPDPGNRIC